MSRLQTVRTRAPSRWGGYELFGEIAAGGMASIEYGCLSRPYGFRRPVVIKRLHPHLARDPQVKHMFVEEARLCAHMHHANLIAVRDVVEHDGELGLVMEYVHGETLASLLQISRARGIGVPVPIATTVLAAVLHGLHAAHEARDERGQPLHLVHRDVTPHNVLVGGDGVVRVLDFGIAKAIGRLGGTLRGEVKGTLAYASPEQLRGDAVDRRTDIYAASVVLWELLCGRRLFDGPSEAAITRAVLAGLVPPPSEANPEVCAALDAIVLRGLGRDVAGRFEDARSMALCLEANASTVSQSEVNGWVDQLAGERLRRRAQALHRLCDDARAMHESDGEDAQAPRSNTRRIDALEPTERGAERTKPVAEPSPVEQAASASPTGRAQSNARIRMLSAVGLTLALAVTLLGARVTSRDAPVFLARPATKGSDPRTESAAVSASVANRVPPDAAPVLSGTLPIEVAPTAAATPPLHGIGNTETVPRDPALRAIRLPSLPPASTAHACDPPYAVDRAGIRHPKPECL